MTLEPAAYKLDVLYFKFTRAFIMILLFLLLVHTYGADRFWSMAQRQRSAARLFFILIEIEKPIVPEIRRPRLSCDLDTRGFGCRKVSVPRFESRLQIAPKDTIEPNINR